jgi:hypothetical protein
VEALGLYVSLIASPVCCGIDADNFVIKYLIYPLRVEDRVRIEVYKLKVLLQSNEVLSNCTK